MKAGSLRWNEDQLREYAAKQSLDLLRLAASQERSMSDLLYVALRQRLYGDMVRLEAQVTTYDKVNHE